MPELLYSQYLQQKREKVLLHLVIRKSLVTSPSQFSDVIRESPVAVGEGRSERCGRNGASVGRLLEQLQRENLQERN